MERDEWEIYAYTSAGITSLFLILLAWKAAPFTGIAALYLLFLLSVTLNAWLGGLKTGLIVTAVGLASAIFFFVVNGAHTSQDLLQSSIETLLFTLVGMTISFVIEKYKKTDLVTDYRKKNKHLKFKIVKIEEEKHKLEGEIKMRDEFLSIASHELKTPLTSMLLKIQMILHNIRNVSLANFSVQKLLDQLETAEDQTKRLSRMINDLLNVSLITTGKMNLEPAKEDVAEITREVAGEFAEKLEKAGYEFTLEANEPIEMCVDKLRIAQVVSNLISNAIRYGDGKPITVRVQSQNGTAKIIVKDNGLGIHEDEQKKIFHLFERGTQKNGIKGLGVGLYICNQIVKAHGGSIHIDSKPATGSTFTVELPIKN